MRYNFLTARHGGAIIDGDHLPVQRGDLQRAVRLLTAAGRRLVASDDEKQ